MTSPEEIQESQYVFPYHYLDLHSKYYRYVWDIETLLKLRYVKKTLLKHNVKRMLDVGCGDGRLIFEFNDTDVDAVGIDVSQAALRFAKAFSPKRHFVCGDVGKATFEEPFDAVTCIEVMEHIEPEKLPGFVEDMKKHLKPGGRYVATIPGVNLPLEDKHYQHFTKEKLHELLDPMFSSVRVVGLHKKTKMVAVVKLLSLFLLFINKFNGKLGRKLRHWHERMLLCPAEKAQRFMVICEK